MTRMTAKTAIASLIILATALSGCMSSAERRAAREGNPAPCPNVIVLQDAGRLISFAGEETLENIAYTGEITNIESSCRYFAGEPIEADLEVDFAFGRGPQATDSTVNVEYFVAITRTNRDLISKEVFTLPVRFSGNRDVVTMSDRIGKITIPRKDDQISGTNFEIVVGLALSKDQVLYNRSGKSLKFPNLD